MGDELSGIEEAIQWAGGQEKLARAISEKFGCSLSQPHISIWKLKGYVPGDNAHRVAKLTGVAIERLLSPKVLGRATR